MRTRWMPVWGLAAALAFLPGAAAAKVDPLPRLDIIIDTGHGGVDGGTSFGNILEKDINLAVGMKLYPMLRHKGITASLSRTQDYALSDDNKWLKGSRHKRDLAQRVEIVNRLKPACLLSLHVNWSDNHSRRGPLVIYQNRNESSKQLALHIQQELNTLYGTTTKPEPGRSYYLLRRSQVPSVIIEMGFMSNSRDRGLLTSPDFQHKLADAIAKASETALKEKVIPQLSPSGGKTD